MARVPSVIKPVRTQSDVIATWSASGTYQYIWASCTAAGYEKWVAVRSESWEDRVLEWHDVPANATIALMAPKMKGEQRIWITLATATV